MNKIISILLISILAMSITASAEVLNLTQKNSTWFEVLDGANATLIYSSSGEMFTYSIEGKVPNNENYSLIYYEDQENRFVNWGFVGAIIDNNIVPDENLSISKNGTVDIGSIPHANDTNYPNGSKIWLIPTTNIHVAEDNITMIPDWNPDAYLFEENLRDENNTEIPGTSHLIVYTKIIETPTPAQMHPSTSSSSGSSAGYGGSGVNSNEPFSNIAESDRKVLNWRAGLQTKYAFKYNVYEVVINASNNEDDVMVKYEGLKSLSSNVISVPPGEVYQYFNLYPGSKRFESAVIRFKSDKTPALLYRWTSGKWEALPTTPMGIEGNNILYEVEVLTFSNFALASVEMPTPAAAPYIIQADTPTQPEATPQSATQTPPIPAPTTPGFEGIGLLISGIVAIGLFKFRKN